MKIISHINQKEIGAKLSQANKKVVLYIDYLKRKIEKNPTRYKTLLVSILIIVFSLGIILNNQKAHAQTINLGGSSPFTFPSTDQQGYSGMSIPSDCSTTTSAMLNDFFANYVPANTTVILPNYGCYLLDDILPQNNPTSDTQITGGVTLNQLTNLTIIGNGTTFKRISPTSKVVPMFSLINNVGLSMSNLTIDGGYNGIDYGGTGQYEGGYGLLLESNHGVVINGVNVNNTQGDGINLWFSKHILSNALALNTNILVINSNFYNIGYHGITLEGVNGATFENNNFRKVAVDGIDAEYDIYSTLFDTTGTYQNPSLYPYPAAEDNVSIVNNSWNGAAYLFYVSIQGQSPGVQEQNNVVSGNNIQTGVPIAQVNGTPSNNSSTTAKNLNDGLFFQDNYMSNNATAESTSGGSITSPDVGSTMYLKNIGDINIDNNYLPLSNGNINYYANTPYLSAVKAYGLGNSIANIYNPTNNYDSITNPYAPNNTGSVGFNLLNNNFNGAIQVHMSVSSDWININNPAQTTKTINNIKIPGASITTAFTTTYATWVNSTIYNQGDLVTVSGVNYVFIDKTSTAGINPTSNATDPSNNNTQYWLAINTSGTNSLISPSIYSSNPPTTTSIYASCNKVPDNPSIQYSKGDVIEVQCSYYWYSQGNTTTQSTQPLFFYYVYTGSNPSNSNGAYTNLMSVLQSQINPITNTAAPINVTNQCNNTFLFGIQDFSQTNGPSNTGSMCSSPPSKQTCSKPINLDSTNNPIFPENYQVGNPGSCYYPTPPRPTNVSANYVSSNSVNVTWSPVVTNLNANESIAGYYILRSTIPPTTTSTGSQAINSQPNTSFIITSNSNGSPITCSSSPCSFTDTNVSANTQYYYSVEAYDGGDVNYLSSNPALNTYVKGASATYMPPSVSLPADFIKLDISSQTPQQIQSFTPDTPTQKIINPNKIDVTWSQNSSFSTGNIGGYYVYRSSFPASPTTLGNIGTIVGSVCESSSSICSTNLYTCKTTDSYCVFSDTSVTGGKSGVDYFYTIVAFDLNAPANLSTPSLEGKITLNIAVTTPTKLIISTISDTSLNLAWAASTTSYGSIKGYNINQGLPQNTFSKPGIWNSGTTYNQGSLVSYNSNYYVYTNQVSETGNQGNLSPDTDTGNWKEITPPVAYDWATPGVYSVANSYFKGDLVNNVTGSTTDYYVCIVSSCTGHSYTDTSYWVKDAGVANRTRQGLTITYKTTALFVYGAATRATSIGPYYYCINVSGCPKATLLTNSIYFQQVTPPPSSTFVNPGIFDGSGTTQYYAGNLVTVGTTGNYYIYINSSSFVSGSPTPTLDNTQSYWVLVSNNPYTYTTPGVWTKNATYKAGDLVSESGAYYVYINSTTYSGYSFVSSQEPSVDNANTYWLPISTSGNNTFSSTASWNNSTTYTAGDIVSYLGYYFIDTEPGIGTNSNSLPTIPSSGSAPNSNWLIISNSSTFVLAQTACLGSSCTYTVNGLNPSTTYSFNVAGMVIDSMAISNNSSMVTGTTNSNISCNTPLTPTGFAVSPIVNTYTYPGVYSASKTYTLGNYIQSLSSSNAYYVFINSTPNGNAITDNTSWLPVVGSQSTYTSGASYVNGNVVKGSDNNYYIANNTSGSIAAGNDPVLDIADTFWLPITSSVTGTSATVGWNTMPPSGGSHTSCTALTQISNYKIYKNSGVFAYINHTPSAINSDLNNISYWYPVSTRLNGSLYIPFIYSSTKTYRQGDVVQDTDNSYYLQINSSSAGIKGTEPINDSSNSYWAQLNTNSNPFSSSNSTLSEWQSGTTYSIGNIISGSSSCSNVTNAIAVANYSDSNIIYSGIPSTSGSTQVKKIPALTPGTNYTFCLGDTDSNTPSLNSLPASLSIKTNNFNAPGTPKPFNAILSGSSPSTSVNLAWGPSLISTKYGNGLSGYVVFVDGVAQLNSGSVTVGQNVTSYVVTGLSPSSTHSFFVEALSSDTNPIYSPQTKIMTLTTSSPSCTYTIPSSPNMNQPIINNSSVALAWSSSTQTCGLGIGNYTLYESVLDTLTNTTTNYTYNIDPSTNPLGYTDSTTIAPGKTYTFYVIASDNSTPTTLDSAQSNSVTFTIPSPTTPPSAPTNLNVTNSTGSEIDLSWNSAIQGTNSITSYNIYENGSSSPIMNVNANTLSANITGLSPNTSYTFSVTSIDSALIPNESQPISISQTTLNIPTPVVTVDPALYLSSILASQNINVDGNESGGSIADIKLYASDSNNNTNLIDSKSSPSSGSTYSFIWNTIPLASGDTNYPDGTYTLTAVATDTSGVTSTSSPVTVYVDNGDVDGFKCVTLHDFSILASHYNQTVPMLTLGDIDANSIVQLHDFSILASNYGYKQPGSNCGGY